MEIEELKTYLKTIRIKDLEIYFDYNIRSLSTFKINGSCKVFIIVNSEEALLKLLNILQEKKAGYFIIGFGSNTLINDNCAEIIIKLGKRFDFIEYFDDGLVTVGASCILGRFITKCYKNKYDFSFLAGIPGTIGGAVFGNCGNQIETICDYIESIEYYRVLKNKITKEKIKLNHLNYGYRFLKIDHLCVITKIHFKKEKIEKELIYINIREKIKLKKAVQPLNTFNCGCFFKNPLNSNKTAGELIDSLGLKGFTFGGAMVSVKHANFLENNGLASSMDVFNLAKIIAGLVFENFKIRLEYEVKLVGFQN
ncbi:MAG: UDP-N-acetylmuramate dehydrogenase [Candidatus Humimicrobiaceae bacterium]